MMERIKWIGIAVVITLVIIIVLQNLQEATTYILFMEVKMPRAVMLFGTLVVGYLSGMIVGNPLRFLRKKSA